jgi:hypothetical protein
MASTRHDLKCRWTLVQDFLAKMFLGRYGFDKRRRIDLGQDKLRVSKYHQRWDNRIVRRYCLAFRVIVQVFLS